MKAVKAVLMLGLAIVAVLVPWHVGDTPSVLAGSSGLTGHYYTTKTLTTLAFTRVDPTINFNWGTGAPGAGMPSDNFSVRWTGYFTAQYSERHTFYVTSNDGARLWVNGQSIIDRWYDHATQEFAGTIDLQAGQSYPIQLEYYEGRGTSVIRLAYASARTPKQLVPSLRLTSAPTYYVSPGGSDSRDGLSPATAWRTFAPISAGRAPAGANILAQAGGVWRETVLAKYKNMRFGVYGSGARPKIIAPDGQYAFDGNYQPGIHLEGWEFTSATRNVGTHHAIVFAGRQDCVVRNIVVHGVHDKALFMSRGQRCLIENSEFYDQTAVGAVGGISLGGWEGSTTPNPADRTIFRNNYVHDTAHKGITTWGSNILIEGNRLERWNAPGLTSSGTKAPAGIYVTSRFAGDTIVRGNRLLGSGEEHRALWADFGPQRPDGRSIFENNYAVNVKRCFFAEDTDYAIFRNNTCERMSLNGVRWGGGQPDGSTNSVNGQITGNTFIGPTPSEGWIAVGPYSAAAISSNTYLP